jgi:hypothetical protein
MKRSAIALSLGLLAILAFKVPTASAQILLLDYVGFDYEDPNPDPLNFGEVGSEYHSLGEVPGLFAPLVPDQVNNEYTYHIFGLTPTGSIPVGPFVIVNYGPGTIQVYEDSNTLGTPFDYGANPPNATSPSSFTDGTLFLEGALTGFQFVFNTTSNSGSFEAAFEVTGGSQFANIPANQRLGWTFAGATANSLEVPEGYLHQVDGQIFLDRPVPAQETSWGKIKASYRQ